MTQNTENAARVGARISEGMEDLVRDAVALHLERDPGLVDRYGPEGINKCMTDTQYNLRYLANALTHSSPKTFETYVDWLKSVFVGYSVPVAHISESLTVIDAVIAERFEDAEPARRLIARGLDRLAEDAVDAPSALSDGDEHAALARHYLDAILTGSRTQAFSMVLDAVDAGMPIRDVYLKIFQPVQWEIGRLWQTNAINVAQEHYCTAATQLLMAQLYPKVFAEGDAKRNDKTLVATCIAGDLHEIGIRMVTDFFEMEGWNTHYLGANTPEPDLLAALRDFKPDMVAVSVTMPFHLDAVGSLVQSMRKDAALRDAPVLIGGGAIRQDPSLCGSLGASGTAGDAESAVALARELLAA